jgi:hypothetical protein
MARLLFVARSLLLSSLAAGCSGAPADGAAPDYEVLPEKDRSAGDRDDDDRTNGAKAPSEPDRTSPSKPASPAGGWCGGRTATFCADFDTGGLPAGFDATDGPNLAIGGEASKPLIVDIPAAEAGPAYSSKVRQSFADASDDVTIAFDFAPLKVSKANGTLLIAAIDYQTAAEARYSVRLVYHEGRVRLEENVTGEPSVFHPFFDIPASKWSRIRLDVVLGRDGAASSAKVSLDEELIGRSETITPPVGMERKPTVLLGAVFGTAPHAGWTLGYDNVTIDLR